MIVDLFKTRISILLTNKLVEMIKVCLVSWQCKMLHHVAPLTGLSLFLRLHQLTRGGYISAASWFQEKPVLALIGPTAKERSSLLNHTHLTSLKCPRAC